MTDSPKPPASFGEEGGNSSGAPGVDERRKPHLYLSARPARDQPSVPPQSRSQPRLRTRLTPSRVYTAVLILLLLFIFIYRVHINASRTGKGLDSQNADAGLLVVTLVTRARDGSCRSLSTRSVRLL